MTAPAEDPNRYPAGWDRSRVEAVIAHYDDLSEEDWLAEDAAAAVEPDTHCRVTIPKTLLPEVRALLAKHAA